MLWRSDQALQRYCCGGRGGPFLSVTVKPDEGGTERYSKSVSDLQSNIVLHTGTYYGTLKHVSSYEEFSTLPDEQEGYYLSLELKNDGEGEVWTKITNGKMKDFIQVTDGYCVYRIHDPKKQTIIVQYRSGDEILDEKTYTLYGLTLADAE